MFILKNVTSFLINDIGLQNGDSIVIGVSGGPDSMMLLYLTAMLREKKKLNIICAHVNHKVRKESDEEQKFVEAFCNKYNIIFELMAIEKYSDDNFHNQAREKRYHFFEELIEKYHAKYLFTAHHGDDLMETILMRMVRGSTLRGYAGFSKIVSRPNYQMVRPLIHLTKSEIIDYLKENQIPWVEDSSNSKDVYTRNRFRKYIVPKLKEEDNNVHHKFYKFSNLLLEYSNYVDKQTIKEMNKIYQNHSLNITLFQSLDKVIQMNLLNIILEQYYQDDLMVISDKHVDMILELILNGKAHALLNLPNGLIVKKSYQMLYFDIENLKTTTYNYEFDQYLKLPNGKQITRIEKVMTNGNDVCRLDSNEISLPLYIRTRVSGDVIDVKGLYGHKKIKDIFIDEKIPMHERNEWPIVTDSNGEVVWIPGIKKSKFDKSKDEKYDIILKYD